MASINNKDGWMINFIHEQDLTSHYMNNTLTGLLHPGIYNANIAVYYDSSVTNPSLHVLLKKGTTLLFSNEYVGGKDGTTPCRRNFTNTSLSSWETITSDSSNKVLIKYTAQFDVDLSTKDITLTSDEVYSEELFLFLKVDSSINSDATSPTLYVAKINTDSMTDYAKDFVYEILGETDNDKKYFIPDGALKYNFNNTYTRSPEEYCFLCLGVIRDLNPTSKLTNFTFTTRGLPEYGYSMIATNNSKYPDLIFSRNITSTADSSNTTESMQFYGADIRNILIKNTFCKGFGTIATKSGHDDNTWFTAYKQKNTNPITVGNGWTAVYGYVKGTEIKYGKVSLASLNKITIPSNSTDLEKKWGTSKKVVPLDSCEYNVSRFLSYIKNVDVWSYVIGELHKSADANDINDIFPVALVYKKEDEDFVNPNNVLSYFDLYYKSSSINIYNGSMNNIFHVIPILEDSSDTTTSDSTSDTTTE